MGAIQDDGQPDALPRFHPRSMAQAGSHLRLPGPPAAESPHGTHGSAAAHRSLRPRRARRGAGTGDRRGDVPPGELVVVGVLRGAFIFMADLVRALPREHVLRLPRGAQLRRRHRDLGGGRDHQRSVGLPIEGKHVLLVEDIVDTGLTLKYLLELLAARRPASVRWRRCCPSRRAGGSRCRSISWASRCPTCSWSATAWTPAQRYRHLPYIAEYAPPAT